VTWPSTSRATFFQRHDPTAIPAQSGFEEPRWTTARRPRHHRAGIPPVNTVASRCWLRTARGSRMLSPGVAESVSVPLKNKKNNVSLGFSLSQAPAGPRSSSNPSPLSCLSPVDGRRVARRPCVDGTQGRGTTGYVLGPAVTDTGPPMAGRRGSTWRCFGGRSGPRPPPGVDHVTQSSRTWASWAPGL